MKHFLIPALVAIPVATLSEAQIFYSGGLGTSMASQGWAYQATTVPSGGTPLATTGFSGGATVNNTTGAMSDRAGWALGRTIAPTFPVLDNAVGYSVAVELSLASESHISNDRAGLSWITMGSDGFGLELGFHEGSVWAQGTTPTVFTHAETATLDTSIRDTYTLSVSGLNYTLSNSGGVLLAGALRNYAAAGATPIPYAAFQNYVFLGDNTAEAQAAYSIYSVAVVPEVPQGATIAGILALPALWFLKRSRR